MKRWCIHVHLLTQCSKHAKQNEMSISINHFGVEVEFQGERTESGKRTYPTISKEHLQRFISLPPLSRYEKEKGKKVNIVWYLPFIENQSFKYSR